MFTVRLRLTTACLLLLAAAPLRAADPPKEKDAHPIRVTVVVVLAAEAKGKVDPKLKTLAAELAKGGWNFGTLSLSTTALKSVPVGDSHEFELIEGHRLTVAVTAPKDAKGRAGLTLKSTDKDEVKYDCACGKFFPYITDFKTKAGETIIIAVSAAPCTGKGP